MIKSTKGTKHAQYIYIYMNTTTKNVKGGRIFFFNIFIKSNKLKKSERFKGPKGQKCQKTQNLQNINNY